MFPYGNPYNTAYTQPYTQPYTQQAKTEIIRVNGEGGARAYQMPPNSSAVLLDETAPVIWIKTTDGAGYPNIKAFNISERIEETSQDFKSLEERIKKLEDILNESYTTNAAEPVADKHSK